MNKHHSLAALAFACAAVAIPAQAQSQKTVVAEPVAILQGFNQWADTVVVQLPDTLPNPVTVQVLQLVSSAPPASLGSAVYHPKPVVLGQPELPKDPKFVSHEGRHRPRLGPELQLPGHAREDGAAR